MNTTRRKKRTRKDKEAMITLNGVLPDSIKIDDKFIDLSTCNTHSLKSIQLLEKGRLYRFSGEDVTAIYRNDVLYTTFELNHDTITIKKYNGVKRTIELFFKTANQAYAYHKGIINGRNRPIRKRGWSAKSSKLNTKGIKKLAESPEITSPVLRGILESLAG